MNTLRRTVPAVAVLATTALTGCSSTHHPAQAGAGSSSPTGSIGTSSGAVSTSSTGETSSPTVPNSGVATSASSASVPSATQSSESRPTNPAPTTTGSAPTGGSGKCFSGTFSVIYPGTDNPVKNACVHMGTAVSIELLALRGVTWTAPTASDPSLVSVADQVTPPGTHHDQVTLLRTGTVTFTSASTYNPDPHGPPSRQWTLTLTIVP